MTEPRSNADKAAGKLSESAKTHLIDVFVSNKYGRQTDIQNKYVEKGMMVEEDSITLYSRVNKRFFKKNEETLSNKWIKGTPDLFTGKNIKIADTITDIKSSWDIYTFFRVHTKEINSLYYWQLQGYMDLSGAKKSTLAYCLVNTPDILIMDEKRKLLYKMGVATEANSDYQEACEEMDKLMRYDDIPMKERVIEFTIERNDADIALMHAKVERARNYLDELDSMLSEDVMIAGYDEEVKATIVNKIPLIKI